MQRSRLSSCENYSFQNISSLSPINSSSYLYGILYSCNQRLDLLVIILLHRHEWKDSEIQLILCIAAIFSLIIPLLFSFYVTKPQYMISWIWISNSLTCIGCLLLLLCRLSPVLLVIIEALFMISESFSYPNLSLFTLKCVGYHHFCNQALTNEAYRQIGGFCLTLIVYITFSTPLSSIATAAFCCFIMRFLSTIATFFVPYGDMSTWETIEDRENPTAEKDSSHTSSSIFDMAIFFFLTIFSIILFNSLIYFSLLHNIFISTHDSDVASTYWILSLLITQATAIGSTLLTSVLIPELGKRYCYVVASLLITFRGILIYLLLQYSSPITHLLFTYLLDGYAMGLLSVLVIVDCEQLSRSSQDFSLYLLFIRMMDILTTTSGYIIAFSTLQTPRISLHAILFFSFLSLLSIFSSIFIYPLASSPSISEISTISIVINPLSSPPHPPPSSPHTPSPYQVERKHQNSFDSSTAHLTTVSI